MATRASKHVLKAVSPIQVLDRMYNTIGVYEGDSLERQHGVYYPTCLEMRAKDHGPRIGARLDVQHYWNAQEAREIASGGNVGVVSLRASKSIPSVVGSA